MGRKRKGNIEVEYELERQIKDLKQEISKLKKLLREKDKDVKIPKDNNIKKVPLKKECPKCGSNIKSAPIPSGILELCENACGYRNVLPNKKGFHE